MQPQDPNSIISSLTQLGTQLQGTLPQVSLPSLNLQLPSASDLDSKYQEFLNRAANDPDIVNYYNQLLQQAQGDTQIAQNFLEQDYQTGVRNTIANTTAALQNLGLTFTGENQTQQDTLNKRGIALTEQPNAGNGQPLQYAQQGEAGTEKGQLSQSQSLRQEAENRSAQQSITGAGQTLQKGITSTGQQLTQTAQNYSKQKEADVASRAGTYYGIYQNQQQAAQAKALQDQQNAVLSGGGSSGKGAKPSAQPDPTSPGIGVNTRQAGWRWTGSEWV